jgi:AcrR family transcriptional regulator
MKQNQEESSEASRSEVILESALKLFWEHGYHGTSVREISREAGTALANVYNYFPSKLDVLYALMGEAHAGVLGYAEDALANAEGDPLSRVRAIIESHLLFHMRHQRIAVVGNTEFRALPPNLRTEYVAKRDAYELLIEEPIRAGLEQGIFRTPFPKQAMTAMLGLSRAMPEWYREDGPLPEEEILARMTHLALQMLEPDPSISLTDLTTAPKKKRQS